jgi:hypothetical protein
MSAAEYSKKLESEMQYFTHQISAYRVLSEALGTELQKASELLREWVDQKEENHIDTCVCVLCKTRKFLYIKNDLAS